MKKTYYVSPGSGEVSQVSTASDWSFVIEATDLEIERLRECLDQRYSSDWQGFFRAHIPYREYHYDRQNDAYDEMTIELYKMLYELGDRQTKEHIEKMGILSN
ncbi:hydrolase [Priestia megaterium]|nr:hydrolase [Priestia megaterium]